MSPFNAPRDAWLEMSFNAGSSVPQVMHVYPN